MLIQCNNQAVRQLAQQTWLWYKDHSTGDEFVQIVTDYDYLVGIEWQDVFEDTLEYETEEVDCNQYNIITMSDSKRRKLVTVDPHNGFRSQDRVFTYDFFMSRWRDTNDVPDSLRGTYRLVEDRQFMFVVTPEDVTFPSLLDMKKE